MGASIVVLLAAAMASGFVAPAGAGFVAPARAGFVAPAAAGSGNDSPGAMAAPAALLGKVTVYPSCLDRYHMQAEEVWTDAHDHSGDDRELDQVSFHDGVGIEVQTAYDGHPLKRSALRKQEKQAQALVAAIDAVQGSPGHLLNLDGEIWTVERFESQFRWTTAPGPSLAGHRTLQLQFRPDARINPHSRMQEILHHTQGDIVVDAESGQVLAGRFDNRSAVNFGAGVLAHIGSFSGSFTLQPLPPPGASPSPGTLTGAAPSAAMPRVPLTLPAGADGATPYAGSGANQCWAMKTIVVHASGRKLFHSFDGTETMTYRLVR